MAESWQAKAKRYARGEFTNAELKVMLGGMVADQVIDIATYGRLSQLKATAFRKVVIPLVFRGGPIAARGAARVVPATLGTARLIAMRHPYVTAAVVTYEAVKHREQINQLLNEGWDIVEPGIGPAQDVARDVIGITRPGQQELFETMMPGRPVSEAVIGLIERKRTPSVFNKAVKAGMAAVKKSTSYGKKGTIKPAKKAFALVTKLASAKKKKKKAPKNGIRRIIWNAMKGLR
jgi:hypothetical protein